MGKELKSVPRFLSCSATQIRLSSEFVNEASTEMLMRLRDTLNALLEVFALQRKLIDIASLRIIHPDFQTLSINKHLIPDIINQLNGFIEMRDSVIQQIKDDG